jgi:CelD/BcsL family acetyltransferase involved in cellulose biosynthesis
MCCPSQAVSMERAPAKVYEVDPLSDPRWTALVESHPRSSVFHSASWLRALHLAYGYEPVVVTTCSSANTLTNGIVFCRIRSWLTGPRLVSLPFSDHCEPLVSSSDELDDILLQITREVDEKRWKYVEIRPTSREPGSRSGLGKSHSYKTHSLDLRRGVQDLFHGFHKHSVQRKIRRAEREGLNYEQGASEALLQKFYKLLVMTRRRHCVPPQPLAWFRGLLTALGDKLTIRVASIGDLPVASILTLCHKKSMVYKYSCSNASFNNLGGTPLLLWNAIQEAKNNGLEELDLGRSDADNMGLIAFKEHWGAVGTELSYWTYPHTPLDKSRAWQRGLARLVPVTPDFALRAAGALLYRHIG